MEFGYEEVFGICVSKAVNACESSKYMYGYATFGNPTTPIWPKMVLDWLVLTCKFLHVNDNIHILKLIKLTFRANSSLQFFFEFLHSCYFIFKEKLET